MTGNKLPVRLIFFSLLLLLSGCAFKFIYNQLDWLIPWYLDDYVSLNYDQEKLFEERLESYLDWHRQQQLPEYASFLEGVAVSSADGLDLSELDEILLRVETYSAALFTRLASELMDPFKRLTDEQVDELFINLEEENDEYFEKYVDTADKKQRHKRAKDVRKFVERWTGNLNEDQEDLIRQWSLKYHLMGQEFLNSRKERQKKLRQVLNRRDDDEYFQKSIVELFANRRSVRSETHERKLKHNKELLKALYLDLDASLSVEQRNRMIRKLKDYAQDFRELSTQSKIIFEESTE